MDTDLHGFFLRVATHPGSSLNSVAVRREAGWSFVGFGTDIHGAAGFRSQHDFVLIDSFPNGIRLNGTRILTDLGWRLAAQPGSARFEPIHSLPMEPATKGAADFEDGPIDPLGWLFALQVATP